jgi:uncharacterized OB-fold protein
MAPRYYLPHAICLKCNKPADLERKVTKQGRVIEAICHSERVAVEFQTEPDVEVRVFGDERSL